MTEVMSATENERYHRQQKLIKGWDQERLNRSSIAIVGEGRLADYLTLDLLSFGFGKVKRIGKSESPNFEFELINPDVSYEHIARLPVYPADAVSLTLGMDCIIDTTNGQRTKPLTQMAASKNNAIYCSAVASDQQIRYWFGIPSRLEALATSTKQEEVPSMLCAALIAEELRKRIMPLEKDISQDSLIYALAPAIPSPQRVLQVGAGAIGTFTSLAFASLGANLTILDPDTVSKSNLNRQCLFYNALGLNKAEALAERLRALGYQARGLDQKVTESFNPTGFDLILACVDNLQARYHLNHAALRTGIPLIDGGSLVSGCAAMPVVPGETACLDCQYAGKLSESQSVNTQSRGGACFHPSIITSNQIAAALMANASFKMRPGQYTQYRYRSGQEIVSEEVGACEDSCRNRVLR